MRSGKNNKIIPAFVTIFQYQLSSLPNSLKSRLFLVKARIMKETIQQLERIVTDYKPLLEKIDAASFGAKPQSHKWSKKEILGHLIDSAMSNIRRFVVGQYEDQPHIIYNQERWVTISNYQHYNDKDLIELWALLNKHICVILKNTSEEDARRTVKTQALHSIEWLAIDYNKHLLHHLHHLLELEPVGYP